MRGDHQLNNLNRFRTQSISEDWPIKWNFGKQRSLQADLSRSSTTKRYQKYTNALCCPKFSALKPTYPLGSGTLETKHQTFLAEVILLFGKVTWSHLELFLCTKCSQSKHQSLRQRTRQHHWNGSGHWLPSCIWLTDLTRIALAFKIHLLLLEIIPK